MAAPIDPSLARNPIANLPRRRLMERVFAAVCLAATCVGLLLLVALLWGVMRDGLSWINANFLTNYASRTASRAGIKAGLFGTLWVIGLTGLIAVPIGIAAAIYMEEMAPKNRLTSALQTNIANLAGVPSIVYGLLGLAVFAQFLALKQSVLTGALTMSLLILPTVILTTQEALRAVPPSLREASYGLGATRWQTIRHQIVPAAFSGIITGIILSLSRAIGETAPLITIGAFSNISFVPNGLRSEFTVLPILIFNWTSDTKEGFKNVAAATIIVLLAVLLAMNSIAIYLRYQRRGQI
jgi:phosphate transport system permease protein